MIIVFMNILMVYLLGIEPYLKKNADFRKEKMIDIFRYITLYFFAIIFGAEDKILLCVLTSLSV